MKIPILFFYLILCLLINNNLIAQDIIFTNRGDSLVCRVEEVADDSILFLKIPLAPRSKSFAIAKKEIIKIRYENGYMETYSKINIKSNSLNSGKLIDLPYDILYLTDGNILKVKIIDVEQSNVNFLNITSSITDKIDIRKVLGIRYSNGYEEAYNAPVEIKQKLAELKVNSSIVGNQNPILSNDIIKLKDGKELRAKIIEVGEDSIVFKNLNNKDTVKVSVSFYDILNISYSNGYVENYSSYIRKIPKVDYLSKNQVQTQNQEKINYFPKNVNSDSSKTKTENIQSQNIKPQSIGVVEHFNNSNINIKSLIADVQRLEHFNSIKSALIVSEKVKFLDLQGQNLKEYPQELTNFKNLVALNLSNNKLKDFPLEVFDLPNLQFIWLDNIGLKNLKFDKSEIEKIKKSNIIFVSLNNNRLTKIHSSIFELKNLVEIRLNNNQINTINIDDKFNPLKSAIQIIDFQKNKFEQIPEELADFSDLNSLNLAENNIGYVEKLKKGYNSLKKIKLNSNPIKNVDQSFYKLHNLEEIDLNQTSLNSLPDSISKFTKLKILILPGYFSIFPNDFGELKSLDELHLNNATTNHIATFDISSSIFKCENLRILEISGFGIRNLNQGIGKLKNLENLYIVNCNLTSIPNDLFSLSNLKILDLSNNRISQIPNVMKIGSLTLLNLRNSPVDAKSLLDLRRALLNTEIDYLDTDLGLNFESKPFNNDIIVRIRKYFEDCDKGDPSAYYHLGKYFEDNKDYGFAIKAYRVVAENQNLAGTGKSLVCKFAIAEIYDDVKSDKSFQSPYKRKQYSDYNDYINTSNNNRAYQLYLQISNIDGKDEIAGQIIKKASARASIICTEISDNLEKIYNFNQSEIERLIQGSGNMQTLGESGQKLLNDSQALNNQSGALLGGFVSLFGKVSSAVKDDKVGRLKGENRNLKYEIENYRRKASELIAK